MAGERIGILNEAIVFTALKRLDFGRKVFWNAKPDRFSVEPDFTIGPSVSEPEIQILVTHSGSAKNSNMKFWRNIAELSEAKIRLPSPPRVFSIFFASHFYRDLLTVTEAAFDGQLLIDRQSYGEALTDWIHESGRTLPAEALEKQSEIERIQAEDPTLDQLVQKLATDLRDLLTSHNASLDPLWHLERKRPKTSAPVARETFVRRGLAKLLAFPDVEKALQLYRGKPFFADTFPDFVYKLGFVARGISHHFGTAALPSDSELENAVSLLHPEEILTIAQNPGSSGFTNQLTKIRGLATFPHLCKFVQRHRSRLTKFEGMLETLESQHSKPTAGIRIPKSEAKPTNVWIFDVISALSKTYHGKMQDFGYSALSKQPESKQSKVGDMMLGDWATCFMNQFVSRKSGFRPPAAAIELLAHTLRRQLAQIPARELPQVISQSEDAYLSKEVEATLLAHRGFEPLKQLILRKTGAKSERIASCFAERAGLTGIATQTTVIRHGSSLINWQSAHGSHTNDKRKELCGRAVALRYTWDAKNRRFQPRDGVENLTLVIDGSWTQHDLDALSTAGWDHILYPDQLDQLTPPST